MILNNKEITVKTFLLKSILFIPRKINVYLFHPDQKKNFMKEEIKRLHNAFENGKYKKIQKIEGNRLKAILKIARKQSPYYGEIILKKYLSNSRENLKNIPLLSRNILIEKGDSLIVRNVTKIPHSELSTSGTTGIPLKFIRSPDYELSHQLFLYQYMTSLKKIDLTKIISFGGMYLNDEVLKNNIFWSPRTPDNIYGYCNFSSFYINKNNLKYYIREMEEISPYIIRSYPSALLLFCDLCSELKIKPKVNIKGIYLTSENVTKEQMDKISIFFNCGVFGQYGHSEACVFAFTKKNDTKYYCSPLYGYVEVVDELGNQVNIGETGQVCVTSFTNKAQPFIRYLTGDLAEYGGKYNGFTVLNKLIGRTQDYILNKENKKLYIIVGEFSECFLPAINNVKYWQAIQSQAGTMILKIVPKDNYSKKDENEIREVMNKSKVEITDFQYVDEIPLTKSGKRKYIIRETKE